MSHQSRALLKLIPAEVEGLSGSSSPPAVGEEGGPRSLGCPSPLEMARWRAEADAHMESALAHFDAAIVAGQDPSRAAHTLCHGFMDWCRLSMSRFNARPVSEDQKREWSREQAVWMGLADLAAVDAPRDPAGVDRFLQIWLGVVHEATAIGRSWLFCD